MPAFACASILLSSKRDTYNVRKCHRTTVAVAVNSTSGSRAVVIRPSPPPVDSFAGASRIIAEFMNVEMKNHLASYAVKFGTKVEDIGLIDGISVSTIRSTGMELDIVTCDDGHCVCIRDVIPWLNSIVLADPEEIPDAVRALSLACGLPDDQI